MLAPLGAELTLTTNASLLAPKAQALAAAGLRPRHRQPRLARRRDLPRDERRRLPRAARARRDRGGGGGRPAREGERGRQARPERARDRPDGARTSAAPATRCASSSTWTSARRTAGASTTSFRRRRSSSAISAEFPLEPVEPGYRGEVAKRWRYADGGGEVGVISSVTQPFCGDCTRARISAEGRLYTCLFAIRGHDLRALVRGGASDEELGDAVAGDLGQAHRPLLRAPLRGRPSRCRRSR